MGKVRTVTDQDFDEIVLDSDRAVLVDFWAPWCGPCRMMGPILDTMAQQHDGKIDIVKVNVDESPVTAKRYSVLSMPTLLVFDHGEVVTTLVGAKPRTMIEKALGSYLA
ncbi:thioredoxin [Nocardia jiangxiensis]|uniref:Thioredoxin n=1 Tax=Nocardia jiangxiensis TaxID=282685 RepID=A0ABW6RUA7_9NOCA|nr:thioredoxin [Nocardia jiangxiensis]